MEYALLFHKRPMAGAALGALLAVIVCDALPDAVLLPLAAAAFLCGLALLYKGKPFVAMLCVFALLCLRIRLVPAFGPPSNGALVRMTVAARDACDAALDTLFGYNGGVAKGILLGDKTDIPATLLDQYRRSGLSHILAVSGLHITILCTALQFILRGLRARISLLITVPFLIFYGALTGYSPSFCRASLMFLCVLLSRAAGRGYDFLSSFCLAFTAILFVAPAAFYSVSFQLSFSCIYGMLMLTQPINRLLRLPRAGFISPGTAVAVQLGILPVAAYYFTSVSTVGVVLSILVIPLIPLFIVPAFAAMLLYFVFPSAAAVVAVLPNLLLTALNAVCAWTDALPLYVSAPTVPVIALYFLALALLSPFFLPNAKRPPYVGMAVAACAIAVWILS